MAKGLSLVPADAPVSLSPAEQRRLIVLEHMIEGAVAAAFEAGRALNEIRDTRLYRQTHATFEVYLRERWGMSRPEAYREIDAARVMDVLSPTGDTPTNERQARELAPLLRKGPEHVMETWRAVRAEHGDNITAAKVRQVASRRLTNLQVEERSRNAPAATWTPPPETERQMARRVAKLWLEELDVALHRVNQRTGKRPPWDAVTPAEAEKRLPLLNEATKLLLEFELRLGERAERARR